MSLNYLTMRQHMARVAIRKSTLDNYGFDIPSVEPRPQMPTEQQIREAVLGDENMGLMSPEQYGMRMPLIEREQDSSVEERQREKHNSGETGRKFLQGMGLEGALATGLAMREFPAIGMQDNHEQIPFLRDYYGRQTTIPEHDWQYHTEGPYYDEEGNILPGEVPPVDAVKLMGQPDIEHVGQASGFGLKPLPFSSVNQRWETEFMRPDEQFPAENISFVGPTMEKDIEHNSAANVSGKIPKGYVGIRGFGRPSDKAFARRSHREGGEGGFTAPIPPERLVGAMPASRADLGKDSPRVLPVMKPTMDKPKTNREKIMEAMEDGIISPTDVPLLMAHDSYLYSKYPYDGEWEGFDEVTGEDIGTGPNFSNEMKRESQFPRIAVREAFRNTIPVSWKEGHFGLENPILTDAEKANYIRQLEEQQKNQPFPQVDEDNTVLYPKKTGVRFA